ncbi:helix-turn-helix domain-containing protein [Collinsella provencensis]|uniref:helix-turn-helix domain-containing protein n=1 Tax=Collinsella provencensis TaxID=1937461 RepID=UPI000C84B2AC|nr:helix-turn-helix transcriptional regulator [Collinsella provencensis]
MDKNIHQIFGDNIRAIRTGAGLTKVDFSLQMGISRVELDLIENGRSNPTLTTLNKLARNLGKEVWELLV